MIVILILAAIGFCVSLYGFFVEQKLKKDEVYKPACDISDRVSCSKPLQSVYSKIFGISNTIWGMIVYPIIFVIALLQWYWIVLLIAIGINIITMWLAYILYFKIKAFCLLCTTIYLVNFGLLIVSLFKTIGACCV